MALSPHDEESFSAFVRDRRHELLRSACMLTAGDSHLAEDLVQSASEAATLAPRAHHGRTAGRTGTLHGS